MRKIYTAKSLNEWGTQRQEILNYYYRTLLLWEPSNTTFLYFTINMTQLHFI